MANGNTLNVEITSSVEGLKKGLVQADKGLKKFDTAAKKVTTSTAKMGKTVVRGAVPAMTSFSQVIQDAPFGIRGVANNITQLTMQMGHLSKNAGGTGAAIKAMGATLMGPAGILLAVSLVTSLMVSYGDELANIGNESGKLIKKNEELVESFESAGTVLKAQVGALDAQLKLLELQKIPIKELLAQKLKLLEADLQSTVQQRTALSNQISAVRATAQQLSLTQKLLNLISASQGRGITEVAGIDREELNKINELEANLAGLDKTIANTVLAIGKIRSPEIFDPKKTKKDIAIFAGETVTSLKTFQNGIKPIAAELNATILNAIPSNEQITLKTAQMQAALIALNQGAKNIIEGELANTFSGIGESIGNAFSEGTNALAAVGTAITQGLGNLLSAMGDYLIQAGTAAILAGTLTKLFGSIAGVGAGFAAIAGGTILKAFGTSVSNFSGAVNTDTDFSDGGSSSFTGSSGNFSSSSGGGGTYVFEIAGTKLVGVLKNTLDRNRALGGSNNLVFG